MSAAQKVFITGGSGFIGTRVVRQLVECGHTVKVLLRLGSRHAHRLRGMPIEIHAGDLMDGVSLQRGMQGCDSVVHLAAPSAWTDLHAQADQLETLLVAGVRNVATAAVQAGVRRMVHVSSLVSLGGSDDPRSLDESMLLAPESCPLPYSRAKRRAECWIAQSAPPQLEIVTVLPGEVYGPDDDDLITAGALLQALQMRPLFACRGGASVVHVDDVAIGIIAALNHGCSRERYILGGDNLSITEILTRAVEATGTPRKIWTLPNKLVGPATAIMATLPFLTTPPREVLDYATRYWWGNYNKAKLELNYAPRPASEAITAAVNWLQSSGRLDRRQ